MSSNPTAIAEVFSAQEIARAAGVSRRDAQRLLDEGRVRVLDGGLVSRPHAVRAVKLLRGEAIGNDRELFLPHVAVKRSPARAFATSSGLHAAMLAALLIVSTLGVTSQQADQTPPKPVRLVFLSTPGPGGGGGGGGLRQPAPPPPARLRGPSRLRSPIPPPRRVTPRRPDPVVTRPVPPPVRPQPVPRPVDAPPPPVAKAEPMPQVVAPVMTAPADPVDRAGVLAESASDANSQGPGSGGGAGTGQGTGIGEGDGSGIGPGSGGGTGGGPYRPGSGITAPELLREVKPEYTQEARRRSIEGDVVLEIIVRRDGGVGNVKIMQGLDAGLNQRAVEAVRQWRFAPARRYGTPVDVVVEVAVEFKLR